MHVQRAQHLAIISETAIGVLNEQPVWPVPVPVEDIESSVFVVVDKRCPCEKRQRRYLNAARHPMANTMAQQTTATTSPILSFICDPASIGQVIEVAITAVFEKKIRSVLVIEKDIHFRRTSDMARNDGCIVATLKTWHSHGQRRVLVRRTATSSGANNSGLRRHVSQARV
jgi:hypothetical protein